MLAKAIGMEAIRRGKAMLQSSDGMQSAGGWMAALSQKIAAANQTVASDCTWLVLSQNSITRRLAVRHVEDFKAAICQSLEVATSVSPNLAARAARSAFRGSSR